MRWLTSAYNCKSPLTFAVFSHVNVGAAAERYIKLLVETHERKWSYAARIMASLVAVAGFVRAEKRLPDHGALGQLTALHLQARQQAHQQDTFDVAAKPFLDWDAIQRVRVAAEEALDGATTEAAVLKLTRDVLVLRLLGDQPPDRVGVVRLLRLGHTLKMKADGSYVLDLSEPGCHKTAAIF
eukprot:7376165-Prymnesium_polylepis.1